MAAWSSEAGLVLRGGRCLPWDEVYHVEWTRRGGLIATSAGVVKVDRETADAIEKRIAPWEAERDALLTGDAAQVRGCGEVASANGSSLVVLTRHGRVSYETASAVGQAWAAKGRACLAERDAAVCADGGRGRFWPDRRPGCGVWVDDGGLTFMRRKGSARYGWGEVGRATWLGSSG